MRLPVSAILLLSSLASEATARHAIPSPAAAGGPAARITQAPSRAAVDLRLRHVERRATPSLDINTCATSCLKSIVTKSTTCTLGDYYCECEQVNQNIIEMGAVACVYDACGYAVGAAVWSAAADLCTSISNGDFDSPTSVAPSETTTDDAEGTTVVMLTTKTDSAGSVVTVTSISTAAAAAAAPTSSSSSNSNAGSSSGAKTGLSTGATAGIAVGAAGGAIIICAILFLIWRSCARRPQQPASSGIYAPVANPSGHGDAAAGPPPPGGMAEIDGTTPHTVTPSPAPPTRDNLTKYHPPHVVSASPPTPNPVSPVSGYVRNDAAQSVSPGPPSYVPELHGQQQQQQGYQVQHPQRPYQTPGGVVYHEVQGARPEMEGYSHGQGQGHWQGQGQGLGQRPGVPYQEMEQPRPEMMGNAHYPQEAVGNVHYPQEVDNSARWYGPMAHEMSSTPRPEFAQPR